MPKHRPLPAVIYAVARKFLEDENGSVAKLAEYAQQALGERGLNREGVYPVLREALRTYGRLDPPLHLALPQQISQAYALDPQRHNIQVVDVAGDEDHVGQAIAVRVASLLQEPLENWAHQGRPVPVGLGPGHLTRAAAKHLHQLLDAMLAPPDFHLLLLPALRDYGDLRLEDHPATFARFLETSRSTVRFVEDAGAATEFSLLQSDRMARAVSRWTIVLAEPGDRRSLAGYLQSGRGDAKMTVVTDVATATSLVPTHDT